MLILGISAFFHDAAAALIRDGEILAAAQEERFTRIKNDASFPLHAIRSCLDIAQVSIDELDAVVFYDKPLLKLERILESYHARAPFGWRSFLTSMPVWMKQKMMLKKVIRDELSILPGYNRKKLRLLFCEHHLSHAASAFYVSPYEEAAILTIDGVGEWATTSISAGKGKDIRVLKEIRFPHSLGLLYSSFTYYCGFEVNAGEYKLMGLAPYGDPASEEFLRMKQAILEKLITVYEDGSFVLQQKYFNYLSGLRMVHEKKWEALFGCPRRKPESALEPCHCNMALAIQRVTEDIVLKLAATTKRLTGLESLCMAGGVALNCVANGKILDTGLFRNIFIQPAAGDAGGALGAALAAYHIYFGQEGKPREGDGMQHAYLGPAFHSAQMRRAIRTANVCPSDEPPPAVPVVVRECGDEPQLMALVARCLKEKKIVGWFQGRMEFGPRALGNRSILADAADPGMQRKLNLSIKYREGFRPFAPVCRVENARRYFNLDIPSPYMLLTRPLAERFCLPLPEGYGGLGIREKLDVVRSSFPSITHVDLSCRVQTVTEGSNPRLWQLLKAFEELTGEGLLINTSFNVRDEPIVCSPEDAIHCFMHTEMDVLVMDNFVIYKEDQALSKGGTI
ncbi:MAG TPA: carbamoyltransferase N-terminal domain-containing protein [Puia sp.]|nr:carbamoyltransferase N-terminal domain-containing protein [Puia sp.]